MVAWAQTENRYRDDKVFDACGLFGLIDTGGRRHGGDDVVAALDSMRERGNGLGSGYAAYGIYPDFDDHYAFHVMCRNEASQRELEGYLRHHFDVAHSEPIPHREVKGILDAPIVWRYFVSLAADEPGGRSEEDQIVRHVMEMNSTMSGAFVFSSGKDMGIFKGVGHPQEIAEFYRIDEYESYLWTAHNRFPTNTPGWWGGAHPFGLLDWSVVHNGEISSYGINRRYLEMHGYLCTMRTDTEVVAYACDLLMRRHGLSSEWAAQVLASPLWDEIAQMLEADRRGKLTRLRQTYGPLLMNGPFTIIVAREGELLALADRIRLRPLVAATKGDVLYVSSELSAIGLLEPELDAVWTPEGGQLVVGRLGESPLLPADRRQRSRKQAVHV